MQERLTHADELKLVDFEIYQVRKKLFNLNKRLKHVRVTDVEVTYSEPQTEKARLWWQFWKK